MKKIFYIITIALLSGIGLTACTENDVQPIKADAPAGSAIKEL